MKNNDLQRFITPMEPPRFLCRPAGEGFNASRKKRQRQTWKEFAAPLHNGGPSETLAAYESLQRLERRLTDRHEELTEAQKRAHNRMMMFRALVNVLMQKAGQYDLKGDDQIQEAFTRDYANADPTEAYVSATFDVEAGDAHKWFSGAFWETDRGDLPEGATFYVKPDGFGSPWAWKVEAGKPPQLDIQLSDERMERFGINPELIARLPRRSFTGGETWNEAAQRLSRQTQPAKDKQARLHRTAQLIGFRRSTLQNVLYQFELRGKVPEKLPEGDLQQVEGSEDERDRADKICHALVRYLDEHGGEYPQAECGEPFNGNLTNLYEWGAGLVDASSQTVQRTFANTGLLPVGPQGDSTRLPECLDRMEQRGQDIQEGAEKA